MSIITEKIKKEKAKREISRINDLNIEMLNPEFEDGSLSGPKNRDIVEANIPKGIRLIKANAFLGCKKLEKVTIPNTVAYIDDSAFEGCESLRDIFIPASVKKIGARAFQNCENLERVVFEDKKYAYDTMEFGPFCFAGCSRLLLVTLCEGLRCVPEYAFFGTELLRKVFLPDTVNEVKEKAFIDSGIKVLRTGKSLLVTNFDVSSIRYARNLNEIHVPVKNAQGFQKMVYENGLGCRVLEEDIHENIHYPQDKETEMIR